MNDDHRRDKTGVTALDRWAAHRRECPHTLDVCRADWVAMGGWEGTERRVNAMLRQEHPPRPALVTPTGPFHVTGVQEDVCDDCHRTDGSHDPEVEH